MKNIYITAILGLLLTSGLKINAQSWDFNDVVELNGWTTHRLNESYTATHIVLSTNGQNNPRFEQASANVDAEVKKFAIIKMRVATGGPTFLRVQYGSNNGDYAATPINTGTSGFETYYVNMTDANWGGTFSDIKLWFRENDGSPGGATHNSNNIAIEIESIEFVDNIYSGATELYVDLDNGNDNSLGTSASPLKSITYALNTAAENDIANVYIKSGSYNLTETINVTANANTNIVLSPEPGGSVTINTIAQRGFRIYNGANNIEIKGFEINGLSNNTDHWVFVSQYVWLPQTTTDAITGGGIAFQIEQGDNIKITNNSIHDFYQKAVNIEDGRYVKIEGNIINNIGLTSLSGGHGIMRQQGAGSFPDADDPNRYRWDIDGNLIFNVHQRIYSWVPWKGYLNMTLDEGKPILIDETPNHDTGMKARINNNVVAFSKIDAIRLKPTNNLEVTNNTVFTRGHHADGITDTANGFDEATYGTPFLNFVCENNAVDVYDQKQTYELGDSDTSTGSSYSNNYGAFGTINPNNAATILNKTLFNDPENGDFSLSDGSLTNVGINPTVLSSLIDRANSFNVTIQNDFWEHDHLKMMQTLWDNVPGLEDGIANNESVFTDAGTYDISDLEFNRGRKALYFSVNTTWKSDNGVTNAVLNQGNGLDQYDGMYEIIVPEEFSDWYDDVIANHLNSSNNPYDRIRYGASVLAQNKVFQDNVLHVVELESASEYTQTEGYGYNVTLAGDLLVNFKYVPKWTESFDLIIADDITDSFNNVIIDNYIGDYTLEIVDEFSFKVLRLTLIAPDCIGETRTWDGTNWSGGITPGLNDIAIIAGNYNTLTNGSIEVCELIVDNTLTISENTFVSAQNMITVNENASLIINHKGSLVQVSDNARVVNNGTINVALETPELKPRDIIFLGSPMTTETRNNVFATANRVMNHNTDKFIPHPDVTAQFPLAENFADDNYNDYEHYSGLLNPGEGYLIRPRPINAVGNEIYSVTFSEGSLNNGEVIYNVKYNGTKNASYNMLANPYPSAIDVRKFIDANEMVDEVYYWEHVQSPSAAFPGANTVNFSMEDISVVNLSGGTAAASQDPSEAPSFYIATGQGFGIKANAAGTAIFKNDMRETANNNGVRNTDNESAINRLWLNVTNSDFGLSSNTLISFNQFATSGYDPGYDSNRLASALSIYSNLTTLNEEKELAIQTREDFNVNQEILIGFSTLVDDNTEYRIALGQVEGVDLTDSEIYLEDLQEGITINLKENDYTITASKGVYNKRFKLKFKKRNLNTTSSLIKNVKIYPNPTEGILTIASPHAMITQVQVKDLQGRVVVNNKVSGNNLLLDLNNYQAGVYFISIDTEKGSLVKKIIKK